MINAYKNFFKGYVDFAGRSTRSDYWWVWLGNFILYIPFFLTYGNALANSRNEGALITLGFIAIIYFIFGLALFLPSLALMVRRLRDAGFHWALIFILFVPLGYKNEEVSVLSNNLLTLLGLLLDLGVFYNCTVSTSKTKNGSII